MLEIFSITVEVICFLTALLCLFKIKDNAWRGMIIYLFLVCVTELIGYALKMAHRHNAWVYNVALLPEALFNSLLFGSILKQYIKSRPLIIGGLALIFAVYAFEVAQHSFLIFNDLTTTVMGVVFVVYSFYYYFLLIKDENYTDLKRSASFWWVTGSLFYYFGGTASNLFYGYLSSIKIAGQHISFILTLAVSLLLYGCWIYSFICRRWQATTLGT